MPPCDRYVLGGFKAFKAFQAIYHRLYPLYRLSDEEVDGRCSKALLANNMMIRAWQALPTRVVEKASCHFPQ